MTNGVDLGDMAHKELSHLDLHYLLRYMLWSADRQERVYAIRLDTLDRFSAIFLQERQLLCFPVGFLQNKPF